ncbi:MAG: hypothetical protein RH982_10110 [Parvibaculum sp.]
MKKLIVLALYLMASACGEPDLEWSDYFRNGEISCYAQDIPATESDELPAMHRVAFSFGPEDVEGFEQGFDAKGDFFGYVEGTYSDDELPFRYFSYAERVVCSPDNDEFVCHAGGAPSESIVLRMSPAKELRLIDGNFMFARGVTNKWGLSAADAKKVLAPLTPPAAARTSAVQPVEFLLQKQDAKMCQRTTSYSRSATGEGLGLKSRAGS